MVVDFTTLSDTDRSALRRRLQEQIPPAECFAGTRIFAVASGKGGVGKSSVSVNLAVAMARQGQRVAILDADVYGFSVPRMLGIDRTPLVIDSLLVPPEAEGVAVVSVGFFVDEGTPGHLARARCSTRCSSSSSTTCGGAGPTCCSSTCRPAPATCR